MTTESSDSRKLTLRVETRLYPESVLFKCIYWHAGSNEIEITTDEGGQHFVVTVIPHDQRIQGEALRQLEVRIRRDLIDFRTRQLVLEETRNVRDLLVAKAFANEHDIVASTAMGGQT